MLLKNVVDGGVYDLAIQCSACNGIAQTPGLPPGRGIGGVVQVIAPGRYNAGATRVTDCDQVIVGAPGIERRVNETGARPRSPDRFLLDPAGIRQVLRHAREIFAPILPRLMPKYRRAPERGHRLAELIARLEGNLLALEQGSREVDVLSALELFRATFAFTRWAKDPNGASLVNESKDRDTFTHNVALLTVASALVDAGLGSELVAPGGRPKPDLRFRVSARRLIEADVKAPVTLQRRPGTAVSPKEAGPLVSDALRSSRAQFTSAVPSLLIIGGAFWTHDFDEHAAAAAVALRRTQPANLIGVVLMSTTVEFARVRGTEPFEERWEEVDWSPTSLFRWIANPFYALDLQVAFANDLSKFDIKFPT